jgi:hypothetical protein
MAADTTSLIAKWHPVTSDFGLIRAPQQSVVRSLLEWHASIEIEYRRAEIGTGPHAAFEALLPLSNAKQRRLFFRTASDWTACYQNGIQGSDPFPAMSFLSERLGVLAMRVCSSPPGAAWPAVIWEVYAPPSLRGIEPLGYRRSIGAANDGGRWVFDQSGEPFPFERVECYTEKRKRDRFSRQLLEEYLGHFGIRPFEDGFLIADEGRPAILLQQVRPVVKMREFSLEEVVAGVPWHRQT